MTFGDIWNFVLWTRTTEMHCFISRKLTYYKITYNKSHLTYKNYHALNNTQFKGMITNIIILMAKTHLTLHQQSIANNHVLSQTGTENCHMQSCYVRATSVFKGDFSYCCAAVEMTRSRLTPCVCNAVSLQCPHEPANWGSRKMDHEERKTRRHSQSSYCLHKAWKKLLHSK